VFTGEDSVVIKFLHQNKGCYAKFLMQAKTKYTELWLILSLMNVKKIRQFLFSIKEDAHKRKLVLFFLSHGVRWQTPRVNCRFSVTLRPRRR